MAKLDGLFSTYIRTRDKRITGGMCTFDCGQPIHCAFHFVTRAKYSLRWDERNAVGSCSGCNFRYEFDPHFAVQWYLKNNGQEAYETLIRDGNRIAKFSLLDLESIHECLKKKLELVCLEVK